MDFGAPENVRGRFTVDDMVRHKVFYKVYSETQDGLVPYKISKRLKDAYESEGNEKGAVLWMPFRAHAADMNFSGNYNQVFLHYTERFMYFNK